MMWRLLTLMLALAAPLPAVAAARPATAVAPAATVTLPFAPPPLGVPIRYAFEQRSEVGGVQRLRLRSVDELTFTAAADGGYLLS